MADLEFADFHKRRASRREPPLSHPTPYNKGMPDTQKSAAARLATPVQFLKGAGPRRAELLARLELCTAADVLFCFPRDYQDLTEVRRIADLEEGPLMNVRGTVIDVQSQATQRGGTLLAVLVRDEHDPLRALWFNQPQMHQRFRAGDRLLLSGRAKNREGIWEMPHPQVKRLEAEDAGAGALLPVYPLTAGLRQPEMRNIVRGVVDEFAALPDEVFPADFLTQRRLLPLREALPAIHFPASQADLEAARRRLIYQELLVLQLALAMRRHRQHDAVRAPALESTAKIDARIRKLFPFEFTAGQRQAIAEVTADMAQPVPMNRLLEGDVGSGKTVVAAYAMLLAVAHGYQVALMAPTEVLARQHAATFDALLSASQVRRGLLAGGMTKAARQDLLAGIASGDLDLIVGTQAIIQADVQFARLGLVVVDEQHKFGVRQRARLRGGGAEPHQLVMSATPIPRSLAMTLFGDLDVSTVRDQPPGRQPLGTYLIQPDERERWWQFVAKKLREGRQAYVVVPRVEESEDADVASLEAAYESLANGPLEEFRLGIIHGRMSADRTAAVMSAFRGGQLQALVCTTVVEVGLDVPNATVMTIDGAERFGLSQLHQLRGRIARGVHPGFCGVLAEPSTDQARTRLEAFVNTTDGFRLAEIDFDLRGPGELLGTRQHGLPPFRIADLSRDIELLEDARRDARELITADPDLTRLEFSHLRRMVLRRYGDVLELAEVV